MNRRVVAILAALLLLLGGGALYRHQREQSAQPEVSAQLGQRVFKDLKASDITSIVIRDPQGTLTLEKKDKAWTLAQRNGFPADLDKIGELVLKTIELKIGQAEAIGDKDRERLSLVDPRTSAQQGLATALVFKAGDGRTLAELLLGKKYFRHEPEGDAAQAAADGRFVMLPADSKQALIVAEPFRSTRSASAEWIAKDGLAIERVKSVEYKSAEGDGYRIQRATDGPDWRLEQAPAGARLENAKANSAAYSLSKLEIEDVAASDKATPFDKPAVLKVATFDGMEYTLTIGEMDKDRYAVRVEIEGTPRREFAERKEEKPEDRTAREKSFAEETKRLQESVARNAMLRGHVLLVAKAKLAELLKKKSELLEQKKAEPKKS